MIPERETRHQGRRWGPRLSAPGAPVSGGAGACALPCRGSGFRFRCCTEHDTASENRRLASIVVRDLLLRRVDEDLRLSRTLATRELDELWLLVVIDGDRAGRRHRGGKRDRSGGAIGVLGGTREE